MPSLRAAKVYAMLRTCLYLILLSAAWVQLPAQQNLIPDPGFEDWDGTTGFPATMSGLTHWYNANGTTDHHHVDNGAGSNLTGLDTTCAVGQGFTNCGFPFAGGGVLGAWKGNGPDGSKEWAGTELLEPLVPGECYEISFWVQNKKDRPGQLMETNQWGVCFSESQLPAFNPNLSDFSFYENQWVATPQVIAGSEWQKVELTFTADAPYRYLFIGFMGNVADATYNAYTDAFMIGFYAWFDEVSVRQVSVEVPEGQALCPGDSIQLEFASNYPLSWENGASSGTASTVWAAPDGPVTYRVTATGEWGCTAVDSVQLSIIPPQLETYSALLCTASEAVQLGGGEAGTWSGPGVSGPANGVFDPQAAGPGVVDVFFDADAGCASDRVVSVEILEAPSPVWSFTTVSGCAPLEVSFSDQGQEPGMSYQWAFGDGGVSEAPLAAVHTYADTGTFDLRVSVTYFEGCTVQDSIPEAVRVYPQPEAAFSFTPEAPDRVNNEVSFIDETQALVYQWEWSFGDGAFSSSPAPLHTYLQPGQYEAGLVVTAAGNCQDSTTQLITVDNAVRIYSPSAFSPNGDGVNDYFGIGYIGLLYGYQLNIYDRWGGMIFESTDPDAKWDGLAADGTPAGTGTYTYVIAYSVFPDESPDLLTGELLIVR